MNILLVNHYAGTPALGMEYRPYYLARELGVTHRAITSRLERHGYRTPCPSVRGTPSGMYRGHKIGEKVA